MEPNKIPTGTENSDMPETGKLVLQRGTRIKIHDHLFKVITARQNGKITMKLIGKDPGTRSKS